MEPENKSKIKKKFIIWGLAALVLLGCLLGCAALRWKGSQWRDVFIMPFHKDEIKLAVPLKSGEPLRSFARKLQEDGIVADGRNLTWWLTRTGADRTLRAGGYSLSSGPSWYVAEQLKNAAPSFSRATIIPGALPDKPLPFGTPAEQLAALSDENNFPVGLRPFLAAEKEFRAALLLPETYSLVEENSLPELVKAASEAWYARFGALLSDEGKLRKTAVIASLIQREAQKDEEYPVIAGVIQNRLQKNMLLQIDAGVVYAWYLKTGETLKRVLYKHLEIDSPYNTYKNLGVPPTPICVPSAAAWSGAFSPQHHDFYYYAAAGDGSHRFARTQREHEKNVAAYRKLRNRPAKVR